MVGAEHTIHRGSLEGRRPRAHQAWPTYAAEKLVAAVGRRPRGDYATDEQVIGKA